MQVRTLPIRVFFSPRITILEAIHRRIPLPMRDPTILDDSLLLLRGSTPYWCSTGTGLVLVYLGTPTERRMKLPSGELDLNGFPRRGDSATLLAAASDNLRGIVSATKLRKDEVR